MTWLRFILSHSIFIAVCAAALCFQTALLLHIKLPNWLYGFIFFSTLCSYNFYWLLSGYSFTKQPFRLFLKQYHTNFIVFFIAGIGMLFSLYNVAELLPVICITVMLTLLYALPLLPFEIFHIGLDISLPTF